MRYVSLLFLFLVVISSCGEKSGNLQSLKDEVMAVHDEVMPKMGDMRKTSKSLQMKAETLDSLGALELKSLAGDIEAANEFMMQWMRQFEPTLEGTEEELMKYYSEQKKAILQVKDSMNHTLERGQKALAD
ncbi:MAG: hypothetical protein ACFHWX_17245 [Bacteroidota bacterium]